MLEVYRSWRLVAAVIVMLSAPYASAQTPPVASAATGAAHQGVRKPPNPAASTPSASRRSNAIPGTTKGRYFAPTSAEWLAYQERLRPQLRLLDRENHTEDPTGMTPTGPWWISRTDGSRIMVGVTKTKTSEPKETTEPLSTIGTGPDPKPLERPLTRAASDMVATPSPPVPSIHGNPSSSFGIVAVTIITALAFLVKGLSLWRERIRVQPTIRRSSAVEPPAPPPDLTRDAPAVVTTPIIEIPKRRADDNPVWVPFGTSVRVGRLNIAGPAYVGRHLAKLNGTGSENCLIDPSLPVGVIADTAGRLMDYWPSYESMDPQSRRAFLDWMASSRNAPGTYIGYVFVYFYALERRAILERSAEDRPAIAKELERLLAIYGDNRSFRRYGTALQAAIQLLDLARRSDLSLEFSSSEGGVPLSTKVAVGRRLRDGLPIEPDLLLSLTMSHPSTKVKASAHRSFDLLRASFADECRRRFPTGLRLDGSSLSLAQFSYRAASGSFVSDLTDAVGSLPDAAECEEALVLGRRILDECTERLEAYGKYVVKAPEQASSLVAISLLPPSQRASAVAGLPGDPLAWLRERARNLDPISVGQVFENVAPGTVPKVTPAKIRELAQVLARFGFGIVPDPDFSLVAVDDTMLLFETAGPIEAMAAPSAAYRGTLLTLALGMLVGKADGHLQDVERVVLQGLVKNAGDVTPDERRRLHADLRWLELHPVALGGVRRKVASLGAAERSKIADLLVAVASAGGTLERTEVAILERIYRELNLDPERLYQGLHRATVDEENDEPVRLAGDGPSLGYAIPPAPTVSGAKPGTEAQPPRKSGSSAPVDRRAAIRAETEAAAALLAGVFDTEEKEPEESTSPSDSRGLEPRLGGFLRILLERQHWPRGEFERLAREHGLMPGAALENINSWSFEEYDECLLEDGDPIVVNGDILSGHFSEAAE